MFRFAPGVAQGNRASLMVLRARHYSTRRSHQVDDRFRSFESKVHVVMVRAMMSNSCG